MKYVLLFLAALAAVVIVALSLKKKPEKTGMETNLGAGDKQIVLPFDPPDTKKQEKEKESEPVVKKQTVAKNDTEIISNFEKKVNAVKKVENETTQNLQLVKLTRKVPKGKFHLLINNYAKKPESSINITLIKGLFKNWCRNTPEEAMVWWDKQNKKYWHQGLLTSGISIWAYHSPEKAVKFLETQKPSMARNQALLLQQILFLIYLQI